MPENARTRAIVTAVVIVVVLAVAGAGLYAYSGSEQTAECTVEAQRTVTKFRASDYVLLETRECGDIRSRGSAPVQVIDPDCELNLVHVGSRYRMTTRGLGVRFAPLARHLVGPITLVDAPPDAGCTSDLWLVDD